MYFNDIQKYGQPSFSGQNASKVEVSSVHIEESEKERMQKVKKTVSNFFRPASRENNQEKKQKGQPPGTYVVSKNIFKKFQAQALAALEEDAQRIKQEIKKKHTQSPSSSIEEMVKLSKHLDYSGLLLTLKAEDTLQFQNKRMALSKTIQRNQAAQETWQEADCFVTKLANEKRNISLEDIENLQRMLNKIMVYLNDVPGRKKKEELEKYVKWYNKRLSLCERNLLNPITFAAQSYQYFLHIHPFPDGNGRIGRFMMDLALERSGLPPACLPFGGNVDSFVWEIENNLDYLVLAIKKGILEVCETGDKPSPFEV